MKNLDRFNFENEKVAQINCEAKIVFSLTNDKG